MRHKYATTGIVLARFPVAEASESIVLLTEELGIVRARAQSVRKQESKLASSLQTFAQSDVVLVRGKEGWRLTGAVLDTNWFQVFTRSARLRAGRVTGLMLRLMPGDIIDSTFYYIVHDLFTTLLDEPKELHDAAECLAALRILRALGLDAGDLPQYNEERLRSSTLRTVESSRSMFIARINHGIAASGL